MLILLFFYKPKVTAPGVVESSGSASTAAESTEPSQAAEKTPQSILEAMTLEEKVGQLFFARVPDTNQVEDIKKYHLGGYLLFGRDMEGETLGTLQDKITKYQRAAAIPLLIGSDEEGGSVTRLSYSGLVADPKFYSPQYLYQEGGWNAIKEDIARKGSILNQLGIKLGLFPIADVATDPEAFIYRRTIGLDAAGTSEYVTISVQALQEAKLGSTLKHFPGYGNNRDSHVEIVRDTRTIDELRANDFKPFEAGIAAGAQSILVSHNIVDAIDDTVPASISKPVHDLLRNELKFTGVVMTDDMDMAGLADFISQKEAGLKALAAGNDLVMSSTYQQQIPYVIQAVKDGQYSEEQLNQSVLRVLEWKQQLGLF